MIIDGNTGVPGGIILSVPGPPGSIDGGSDVVRDIVNADDAAEVRDAIGAVGREDVAVNVKDYGAVGDGVTDDTTAIEAAWDACEANRHDIYFPPGNYVYNGTGLAGSTVALVGLVMHVHGAGQHVTTITLGASSYLLKPDNMIGSLVLEDMRIVGGKGAIKQTYTEADTVGLKHISRVRFDDYTECAIATDVYDGPFWYINECWFSGANATSSIGIAMSVGLTDGVTITKCNFQRNRVHIKMGFGNNCYINENGFFESTATNSGGARVAIWVVPTDGTTNNAGNGLTISSNKFGAEFLRTGDYRILYADEGSGATNGLRMPVLDADSTGVIMGHTVSENFFRRGDVFALGTGGIAGDDYTPPIIYSTTPKVFDLAVFNNQIMDKASTILEYRTVPTATTYTSTGNYFGPVIGSNTADFVGPKPSNDPAAGFTHDPGQVYQTHVSVLRQNGSGTSASYAELLSTAITAFSPNSSTLTGITDAMGGADAATMELTGAYGAASSTLSGLTAGVPVWVEFDVAAGASSSLTELKAYVADTGSLVHWVRRVEVPTAAQGWTTYAFSFIPRNTGTSPFLLFIGYGASGDKVKIGRPRVYRSHERVIGGRRSAVATQATTLLTQRQLANDVRNKLIAAGIVSGTPYADPGTAVSVAGMTGTKAEFNTALSDGDFATLDGTENLTGKTVTDGKFNALLDTNGNKSIQLLAVSSALNYLLIANSAAGSPTIYATGTGAADIGLWLTPTGSGAVGQYLDNGQTTGTFKVAGSATNIDLALTPQGTGIVKLGTGASVSGTAAVWKSGTGTPEGEVTAPVGSMFTRTDGGAATTLYVKETGSGNTGWVAK